MESIYTTPGRKEQIMLAASTVIGARFYPHWWNFYLLYLIPSSSLLIFKLEDNVKVRCKWEGYKCYIGHSIYKVHCLC